MNASIHRPDVGFVNQHESGVVVVRMADQSNSEIAMFFKDWAAWDKFVSDVEFKRTEIMTAV